MNNKLNYASVYVDLLNREDGEIERMTIYPSTEVRLMAITDNGIACQLIARVNDKGLWYCLPQKEVVGVLKKESDEFEAQRH